MNNMKLRKILPLLLALALLTGCAAQAPAPTAAPTAAPTPYTAKTTGVGFHFDTVVTVTLYGAETGVMEDIWAACKRYEQMLSRTVPESDVSRINQANGQPVTVSPETWTLLSWAKEISRLSGGAFSVSIAPLSTQWDFTSGANVLPERAALEAALPLVDDQAIQLGDNNTVTLPAGMQVDLGGIAKGFIADELAKLLQGRVYGAVLSLGGNVIVLGDKPDGSLNSIGIQDPRAATGNPLAVVYTKNISTVTSGTYERGFFGTDGAWYHHILDPKTGYPAKTDLESVTIISPSSMMADAAATACIVKGSAAGLAFARAMGLDALFLTADGQTLTTDGFIEKYHYTPYPSPN